MRGRFGALSGAILDLPPADGVEASRDHRNDQEDTGPSNACLDRTVVLEHEDENRGGKKGNGDEESQSHGGHEQGLPQHCGTRLVQIVNDALKHLCASTCRGRQRMRASSISATTRSGGLWS